MNTLKLSAIYLFTMLIIIASCRNTSQNFSGSNEEKLKYFSGFWQNEDRPHDYLCFSYAPEDIKEGKGFFGTFPLEANPENSDLIDTTYYNTNKDYSGGYTIESDKISCWYMDMENQDVRIPGEIKITAENKISTPIGKFRKLSKEEVNQINPNL